jgi:hypothetical protein
MWRGSAGRLDCSRKAARGSTRAPPAGSRNDDGRAYHERAAERHYIAGDVAIVGGNRP